jgi:hypothetical protein
VCVGRNLSPETRSSRLSFTPSLRSMSVNENWFDKYKVVIGASHMIPGHYSEHLARSKFCLVAPGRYRWGGGLTTYRPGAKWGFKQQGKGLGRG